MKKSTDGNRQVREAREASEHVARLVALAPPLTEKAAREITVLFARGEERATPTPLEKRIEEVVAAAPPFTAEQSDVLWQVLNRSDRGTTFEPATTIDDLVREI